MIFGSASRASSITIQHFPPFRFLRREEPAGLSRRPVVLLLGIVRIFALLIGICVLGSLCRLTAFGYDDFKGRLGSRA